MEFRKWFAMENAEEEFRFVFYVKNIQAAFWVGSVSILRSPIIWMHAGLGTLITTLLLSFFLPFLEFFFFFPKKAAQSLYHKYCFMLHCLILICLISHTLLFRHSSGKMMGTFLAVKLGQRVNQVIFYSHI